MHWPLLLKTAQSYKKTMKVENILSNICSFCLFLRQKLGYFKMYLYICSKITQS